MTKKKKAEKQRNLAIKKQRLCSGIKKNKKYRKCTCKLCCVEINIHINERNKDKYTPERMKDYICLNCRR